MNYQLVNARVFGKPKDQLFNITITGNIISAIYPTSVSLETSESIDLEGAWVAPGFKDAHVHTTNTGVKLIGIDLSKCTSYEELESCVRALPDTREVVLGHGWDDSNWSRKADNDIFARTNLKIYFSRIDAHSALASKNLTDMIPDISNYDGYHSSQPLRRDAHGVVREHAYASMSEQTRASYISAAIEGFLSNGITEIHEMAGPRISSVIDAKHVSNLSSQTGIKSELWWGELNGHEIAVDLGATGCGGDLFIDGSFGSRTALLKNGYLDGTFGAKYISLQDATNHIIRGYEYAQPSSFHVIGDAAIEIAVQAFEDARTELGQAQFHKMNHRLEHVEFLDENLIKRIIDLNIVFSMQPQFSQEWAGDAGMYKERIGQDWSKLNPLRPILNFGGHIVFGSDSPVTQIDPWKSIFAATHMHNSEFSITNKSAFRSQTSGVNRSSSEFGVGAIADLAIWDVDHWAMPQQDDGRNRWSSDARSFPKDFPDSRISPECQMTIVDGKIVFSKLGPLHG